ncbi:MAG: ABC transporter ATP-binding protein/permease, partial [Neisseria sp.]
MKTIRRFLSLAAPFWWRNNPWFNWLLLAAVVGFSLAIVRVGVLITDWNKTFYDALAAFDGRAMPVLVTEFLVYIALVTGFIACGNWLRKVLLFRWREHLTRQFQQNWLGGHKHYRLQLTGEPDNPDQRIAEDVAMLSEKSIDLFKYFIMNAAKLGAFVEILWQLSGVQTFTLFGQSITVKGYLVWIALAYSAACTLLTHLIGRKLQPLNVERQHREADYRATLLRVRESAEQIAFYRGETAEEGRLNSRFAAVKSNWRGLIRREFYLESFSAAYLRLSMFIPIIATLPMYLAHSMSFGDMMKARSAFSNVQDGFGWFMDYYKRIIEWAAVVERLAGFQTALDEADKAARSSENLTDTPVGRILESDKISTAQETPDVGWVSTHQLGTNGGSRPTLLAENLSIHTAEGSPLLHNLTLAAASRQWLLLDGRSGIGKTTLMRTLAGLWPYHRGHFQVNSKRVLFLP